MTCPDVEQLLDAFVDTELPPPRLLDVARHAATCAGCDGAIREVAALRQAVARLVEGEAGALDLSGIWPAVAAAIGSRPTPRASVVPLHRKVPVWGVMLALAASVFVWIGGPARAPVPDKQLASLPSSAPLRTMRSSNHADIDRLAGKDIAVRREPKSGTTIIWVSHAVADAR